MQRQTWIAMMLMLGIWVSYITFFAPKPTPSTPSTTSANSATSTASENSTAASSATNAPAPVDKKGLFAEHIPAVPVGTVKTNGMEVTFSSSGGKISQVVLPEYRETIKKDAAPISVISPSITPQMLATMFTDEALRPLASAEYAVTPSDKGFHFQREVAGVRLSKEYKVNDSGYTIDATYQIAFPAGTKKDWGYLMIPTGSIAPQFDAHAPLQAWEVVGYQNDSLIRKTVDHLENGEQVLQGNSAWLAFGNRYFSVAQINASQMNPDIILSKTPEFSGGYFRFPLRLSGDVKDLTFKFTIYAGPKDYDSLTRFPQLRRLIDYGAFSFLAFPLLELLQFFYKFIHNYGIAIILLTILVRALFYPLSLKSFRSMKSMQKLQPQIAALKEKYKDDMQRFNQEQMALFKAHKVNPLGGCLPMLVQLPVFVALYSVLANSIELFHAPFFGWIHDLSSKDPFYVYPVLMGLAMVGQTKLTPNMSGDPIQQKMMYLMPVVLTFIMINLPSGLTIYMFLSTLLGILQQVSMRDPAPAKSSVLVSEKG